MATSAWWLVCALSCVLALCSAERRRPLCLAAAKDRCQWLNTGKDSFGNEYDTFLVYDKKHRIYFTEGKFYSASCTMSSPLGRAWPRLPSLATVERVALWDCSPPLHYEPALKGINVTVTEQLDLYNISSKHRLQADYFLGLRPSLQRLSLHAVEGQVVEADADAFAALEGLPWLYLYNVRPERLPARLDNLEMRYSGVETLPPGALSVITLRLHEPNLTSIQGSAPRLRTLTLGEAPELKTLRLEDAPLQLEYGIVQACHALEDLSLRRVRARALPSGLLYHAWALRRFTASECNLTSVPNDLFAESDKLEYVDLSDNQLEVLPSDLFSDLPVLQELHLQNNRLRAGGLDAVRHLAGLTTLALSGNPLGDLCPILGVSILSNLHQLATLKLSHTNATRICYDWLHDLHSLATLDMSYNEVRTYFCADTRVGAIVRAKHVKEPYLNLNGNPLVHVECSKEDYVNSENDPEIEESSKLRIWLDSTLACDCGSYWLSRIARAHNMAAVFARALELACVEWARCYTSNLTPTLTTENAVNIKTE